MRLLLFSSVDSFVGAFIMLMCSRRRMKYGFIVFAFALCDSVAGVFGTTLALSGRLPAYLHANSLAVLLGILLTLVVVAAKKSSRILWCLPVLLSVDNLLAGWSGAFPSPSSPWVTALASGALAALGLLAARALERLSPRMKFAIRSCAPFLVWLIPIL
jgi:hypothetical protein